MDIDDMIKKYEYKAKVEKIAGGGLFRSKDYLEDLKKLKVYYEDSIKTIPEPPQTLWEIIKKFLTLKR